MCQVCETKFGTFNVTITQSARQAPRTATTAYDRRALHREWIKPSRIYIRIEDEAFEGLSFRKQINAARKMIEQTYPQFEGKLRFSSYAGCSMCPCSPGFIVSERMVNENNFPLEFWIKFTDPNKEPVSEEPEVDMSYVEMATA
jgi:hypothetical protein